MNNKIVYQIGDYVVACGWNGVFLGQVRRIRPGFSTEDNPLLTLSSLETGGTKTYAACYCEKATLPVLERYMQNEVARVTDRYKNFMKIVESKDENKA